MLLTDFWQSVFEPTMPLRELVARGTLIYLGLFFALRLLRRQAGTLGISDLLMVVLLADAAQNGMAGMYSSVTEAGVLVGTILFWDWLIDWLAYRSAVMRRLLRPAPLRLIVNGVLQTRALRRNMLTRDDLLVELREHGIAEFAQVREARLEPNGHISVVAEPEPDASPPPRQRIS